MPQRKKVELLAPAGNMESLKAAVAAGCNAVYLGGTLFSARAFAGNFSHEELIEAVQYCHVRDVKVYVTMNTLLLEDEMENAFREIDFLYQHDIDALLVQDLGLFHYLRTCYPDFSVHCSTQMHIHNVNGVRFMKKMGAERIVLARETPIEIVRSACREGAEIEVFAYGALCISYSGQCLMSQSVKNRSGNRGMCAQCCRLRYFPSENGRQGVNPEGDFMLSPKDLNILDRLPELLDAGVSSLKIEGRMKRPEYVWLVTSIFRRAIDAWEQGREFRLDSTQRRDLMLMFNRGFTEGHLFHADTASRMSQYRPNHQGVQIGTVIRFEGGRVLVKLTAPLYQHDGLRILNQPIDTGLTAVRIEKKGLLVASAQAGDEVWLDCHSKPAPKKGQPLQKTSEAPLLEDIDRHIQTDRRLIPVKISYRAVPGEAFHLKAVDPDGRTAELSSDFIVQEAMKAPLSKEQIETALGKAGDEPYAISFGEGVADHAFIPVKMMNQARRDLLVQLSKMRAERHTRSGRQDYVFELPEVKAPDFRLITDLEQARPALFDLKGFLICENAAGGNVHAKLPTIHEENDDTEPIYNTVISEIGCLWHPLSHVIAGMNLNVTNSYAAAFLLHIPGIQGIILSSELNQLQIQHLHEQFEKRYGWRPACYQLVYGRRTLMYIKNGIVPNAEFDALMDLENHTFPIENDSSLMRVLESEPIHSANTDCYGSYLILTDESSAEAERIQEDAYEELHQRV